jgi:hypothetical protein
MHSLKFYFISFCNLSNKAVTNTTVASTERGTSARMASSGMLRRVTLVRTDVSEELSASFIRVSGIGELGTTLAVTLQLVLF